MSDDKLDAAVYTYKATDRYAMGVTDPRAFTIAPNSLKQNMVLQTRAPDYNITFHNTIDAHFTAQEEKSHLTCRGSEAGFEKSVKTHDGNQNPQKTPHGAGSCVPAGCGWHPWAVWW